jgi:hypothetical protein
LGAFPSGRVPLTSAVVTPSGLLEAVGTRLIIHGVGPRTDHKGGLAMGVAHERQFVDTVVSVLRSAAEKGVESLALPLFGAGVYGWEKGVAAARVVRGVLEWAAACTAAPGGLALKRLGDAGGQVGGQGLGRQGRAVDPLKVQGEEPAGPQHPELQRAQHVAGQREGVNPHPPGTQRLHDVRAQLLI